MGEFKAIETQEELDRIIGERLKRERASVEKELAEAKDKAQKYDELSKQDFEGQAKKLNEQLAAANEQLAAKTNEVSELTARAAHAEGALLKQKIAHANGVPIELAERLSGDDEAAITEDAKLFASFMAPKAAPPMYSEDHAQKISPADQALMQLAQQFHT